MSESLVMKSLSSICCSDWVSDLRANFCRYRSCSRIWFAILTTFFSFDFLFSLTRLTQAVSTGVSFSSFSRSCSSNVIIFCSYCGLGAFGTGFGGGRAGPRPPGIGGAFGTGLFLGVVTEAAPTLIVDVYFMSDILGRVCAACDIAYDLLAFSSCS